MLLALLKKKNELPQKNRHASQLGRNLWGHTCSQKEKGRSGIPCAQCFLTSSHLEKFLHLHYGGISGKVERRWSMFMGNLACANLRSMGQWRSSLDSIWGQIHYPFQKRYTSNMQLSDLVDTTHPHTHHHPSPNTVLLLTKYFLFAFN